VPQTARDGTHDGRWRGAATGAPWEDVGGPAATVHFTGSPAVASATPGRLDLIARGSDGKIYHRFAENGWRPWAQMSIAVNTSEALLGAATPTAQSGNPVPYSDIDVLFSIGNSTFSGWYRTLNNYPFPQQDHVLTWRKRGCGDQPGRRLLGPHNSSLLLLRLTRDTRMSTGPGETSGAWAGPSGTSPGRAAQGVGVGQEDELVGVGPDPPLHHIAPLLASIEWILRAVRHAGTAVGWDDDREERTIAPGAVALVGGGAGEPTASPSTGNMGEGSPSSG
jgi:hypothetical protein